VDSLSPRSELIADSVCPRICNPLNCNELDCGQLSTRSIRGRVVPVGSVKVVQARGRSCKPANLAGRKCTERRWPRGQFPPATAHGNGPRVCEPEGGSKFSKSSGLGRNGPPPYITRQKRNGYHFGADCVATPGAMALSGFQPGLSSVPSGLRPGQRI